MYAILCLKIEHMLFLQNVRKSVDPKFERKEQNK